MATSIDPNVLQFALDACPTSTSPARVRELAGLLQDAINDFINEELEHDEERRSLKGYDPQDIAKKF
jgi:hypothetical protein